MRLFLLTAILFVSLILISSQLSAKTEVVSVQTPTANESAWRVGVAQQNCIRPCVVTYFVSAETAQKQIIGKPFNARD